MKNEEQVKVEIKRKYPHLSLDEVNTCYNLALFDYVSLRYPVISSRPDISKVKKDFYLLNWVFARMIDIVERGGATNVTSYKENGISFTFASSYIDPVLASKVLPSVGVPK